jgi:hypothetical protein
LKRTFECSRLKSLTVTIRLQAGSARQRLTKLLWQKGIYSQRFTLVQLSWDQISIQRAPTLMSTSQCSQWIHLVSSALRDSESSLHRAYSKYQLKISRLNLRLRLWRITFYPCSKVRRRSTLRKSIKESPHLGVGQKGSPANQPERTRFLLWANREGVPSLRRYMESLSSVSNWLFSWTSLNRDSITFVNSSNIPPTNETLSKRSTLTCSKDLVM